MVSLDEAEAIATLEPSIRRQMWRVRDCAWYEDEYQDCTSIRSRLHQRFVYGEVLDCSQWKRDLANCYRWRKTRSIDSVKELIESETKRREERFAPYYNNDVWEHRTEPPPNWNVELPEWMQKENEKSYLAKKIKEDEAAGSDPLSRRQSLCVIM